MYYVLRSMLLKVKLMEAVPAVSRIPRQCSVKVNLDHNNDLHTTNMPQDSTEYRAVQHPGQSVSPKLADSQFCNAGWTVSDHKDAKQ